MSINEEMIQKWFSTFIRQNSKWQDISYGMEQFLKRGGGNKVQNSITTVSKNKKLRYLQTAYVCTCRFVYAENYLWKNT